MFLKHRKYYCLMAISFLVTCVGNAQSDALYHMTFGTAKTDNLAIPGGPILNGYSDYSYSANVCPAPGSYTLVSGITSACFDNSWIPLFGDNTFPDDNGYMMVINDTYFPEPKIIFRDSVRETCNGVQYQFSAAILNLEQPTGNCVRFSAITLVVEDYFGNIIASTNTGDIQFAVNSMGYHFNKYKVDFMVPPGTNGVVLKLIDNRKASAIDCHNGLAIDDIQLRVTGLNINIGFDSTIMGNWVKSSCFQDNRSFTMRGNVDLAVTNPAVHWQQSVDDGKTWADIPGATGYAHTQSFPVPDTFLFRLRGSDSLVMDFPSCGIFSNILKVEVNGLPKEYGASNNSPLCAGQDLVFSVKGGVTYQWSGPNGFSDTSPFAHIFRSRLADSGRYYVNIISAGGCSVIDSTDVIMEGVDVTLGNDTLICKGQTVQLSASGGSAYEWTPHDGLSDPYISNPQATPQETTTYTLKVENTAGCSNSGQIAIALKNTIAVKAIFDSPDYVCRSSDSAFFSDKSQGKISEWNWDFNNGHTSSLANPPMQNYSTGNNSIPFNIRLTVTDTAGCKDSATHLLKIADNCYIAVPTAFTPNNDGLNDYLYPLNAYKATNLIFRVYNRNGRKVFETKDWTNKWDGTVAGIKQSTAVYIWMLEYIDASGKKVFQRGTTALIR
jgi:gliding motility-associated-like protein